jgi:hypothetical protein
LDRNRDDATLIGINSTFQPPAVPATDRRGASPC